MELTFSIVFSEIILCLVIKNLSPYKFNKKDIFELIIISICVTYFFNIINPNLVSIIAFTVPIYMIYKKSRKIMISIVIDFLGVIICILSDFIISFILVTIFKVNIISVSVYLNILIKVSFFMLSFIISYLIGKILIKNISIFKEKKNIKVLSIIIFTIIITFLVFYININWIKIDSLNNTVVIVNGGIFFVYFSIMLLIVLVSIKNINKELEFKSKQEQFNNLQEYANNLENLYNDMRKFRHDYINIISSIVGYIQDKDLEGLEEHINTNIIPLSRTIEENNSKIVSLKNIKISEIKGIISSKILQAQEKGIDISIEVVEEVNNIGMEIIDFSRIVGILLDNAIEAALDLPVVEVKVAIIKKENSIIFLVINNCREDMPQIYQIYKEGFSTKGKNRGLGLSSLKDIVGKYNNITLDTSINNGFFIQNIEIRNIDEETVKC